MANNNKIDQETAEMLKSFVSESLDSLDTNEMLVENLREENNDDFVNAIFRVFHTIKGLSGFFEMKVINKLTHEAETLLDLMRKQNSVQGDDVISVIYSTFDLLRSLLETVSVEFTDVSGEDAAEDMKVLIRHSIQELQSPSQNEIPIEFLIDEAEEQVENEINLQGAEEFESEETFIAVEANEAEIISEEESGNDEMLQQYINDTTEQVEQVEKNLLLLEKADNKKELIGSTFGLVHSIKGNSGFMGFSEIEELAFDMETILDSMRSGDLDADETVISVLFSNLEIIANRIQDLNQSQSKAESKNDSKEEIINLELQDEKIHVPVKIEPIREKVQEKPKEIKSEVPKTPTQAPKAPFSGMQRKDIRVETQKIDKLFDLVGELITIESMVTNNPDLKDLELPNFAKASSMLNKITRELQEITMSVRMMPLEGLFNKMKRLVRDVSIKMHKKIEFHVSGEETEMDKNVIDEIADPLVHILRNAIDHGVESPEERLLTDKEETGHIGLTAQYEGNEILIIIEDDGKGINRDVILNKAIEKGIVSGDVYSMSDNEVFNLVFEPGFSTAKEVTDISGRGVGMDVVRKNLEKLRGSVDVESILGMGSRFTLRIPLTLAIIEAMLVKIGDSMFALPILSVIESLKVKKESISTTMDGLEMVKVRNEVLPIIRMHEVFEKTPNHEELEDGILIIVESRDKKVCLFADEIVGQQQAVVKSLTEYIGKVKGVMGCMILGDGGIGLIVDIEGLVSISEVKEEVYSENY